MPDLKEVPVSVDIEKRTLETDRIRYIFSKQNHMLLDEFSVKKAGVVYPLLKSSALHLYAKPKYFFPLHFTDKDVRSELISYTLGSSGAAGELSFFLDVMSFKISLNLLSEVSVYRDSIHVPVLLGLPVNGSLARQGSGVFYGFNLGEINFERDVETDLPRLKKPGEAIPFSPLRTLFVKSNGIAVAVGIHMPKTFQEMGFSPALASRENLSAFGFPKTASDFGIFYDITRLKKGNHRFEIWFYAGDESEGELLKEYARDGVKFGVRRIR